MAYLGKSIKKYEAEKEKLSNELEECQYQSYEEVLEEINCITQSNEYIENALGDPNHYLRKEVEEMKNWAPKLKRFEYVKKTFKDQKIEINETHKFYLATSEDLERLRIKEKFLLNQSIESFGGTTPLE